MSLDNNNFQNPRIAIIRLLRSQCLCSNQPQPIPMQAIQLKPLPPPPTQIIHHQNNQHQQLLKLKHQLQTKLNIQKNKLNQVPCVLTLAEQIEQVKEIIAGLSKENKDRMNQLRNIEKNKEMYMVTNQYNITQQADMKQHEKLKKQYENLLKTLEITNDNNQKLIRRLTQY